MKNFLFKVVYYLKDITIFAIVMIAMFYLTAIYPF